MKKRKHASGKRSDGRKGFILYLLPEEKEQLLEAAKAYEMPLGNWIRALCLDAAGK